MSLTRNIAGSSVGTSQKIRASTAESTSALIARHLMVVISLNLPHAQVHTI